MFKEWLQLCIDLSKYNFDTSKLVCPKCGNRTIDYMYVGDTETNVGFLPVWCDTCNVGIQISRALIPEGVKRLDFDDEEGFKRFVPNFIQIYPDE